MSAAPKIETQVIETKTSDVVTQAKAFEVASQEEFDAAAEFLRIVKALQDEVRETFGEPKKKAHEAHRAVVAAEKKHLKPLLDAEQTVKGRMGDWHRAEQARIAEARRKAEAEARKAEEEERLRLAAELEAEGDTEGADQVLDEPLPPPPVEKAPAPKTEGIAVRTTWKARLLDLQQVIAAAAEGNPGARAVLQFNQTAADALARGTKGEVPIPGVSFESETGIAARRA